MYAHHGFVRDGDEFLDDGIPHVPMVRRMVPKRRERRTYPFSAIVGHDRLRLALVLCAVRPEIGGVLIRGEKGTAKSTAVRGSGAGAGRGGRRVALRRVADRRHRGPRRRVAGSAEGAARRRARVLAGTAGPRPRRRALRRRGQPAARPPGRRAARRRGDGPGARRTRRRLAQPRRAIRADRHHEPRRGRAAPAAAGPVRADRRRARLPRCRRAGGGGPRSGWRSRPTPPVSPHRYADADAELARRIAAARASISSM